MQSVLRKVINALLASPSPEEWEFRECNAEFVTLEWSIDLPRPEEEFQSAREVAIGISVRGEANTVPISSREYHTNFNRDMIRCLQEKRTCWR